MAGESKITTDHDEIRAWVEERGGWPVIGADTDSPETGMLLIAFPEYNRRVPTERISWDQFFREFEERKLAFQYQEEKPTGGETYFFNLLDRDDTGNANSKLT